MTILKKKYCKQTAVYWGAGSVDGFGVVTYDTPVEVTVRWSEKMELFLDSDGEQKSSRSVVHILQDMDINGFLYLGSLSDLSASEKADPNTISTTRKIKAKSEVPDLRAVDQIRKVWVV